MYEAHRCKKVLQTIDFIYIMNFKDTVGGQDSGGSDMEGGGNANSLDRKHTSTASFDQYRRKHAATTVSSTNSGDSNSLIRRG